MTDAGWTEADNERISRERRRMRRLIKSARLRVLHDFKVEFKKPFEYASKIFGEELTLPAPEPKLINPERLPKGWSIIYYYDLIDSPDEAERVLGAEIKSAIELGPLAHDRGLAVLIPIRSSEPVTDPSLFADEEA